MSRSRKKVSIFKQRPTGKFGKNQANKKVRKVEEPISKGNSYRKLYESWNICDWKSYPRKGSDWYEKGLRK